MINFQKSASSQHKLNVSDLPTAVKSNSYEYSPYGRDAGGYNSRSPPTNSSKIKMQEAKNSINTMINQMHNKKNQNAQALERVKAVNADALGVFNRDDLQSYTLNKSNIDQPRGGFIDQQRGGFDGGNQFSPSFNPDNYINEFNLAGRENPNYQMSNFDRNLSLEQENMQLRRALNQQIRENNQLLKRIKFLEMENEDLKNQLGMRLTRSKGIPSTQYNSINHGDITKNVGRTENPTLTTTKLYRAPNNNEYREYNQDFGTNQRNIMGELDELKRENQRLRQNAIQLLKMSN